MPAASKQGYTPSGGPCPPPQRPRREPPR